MPSSASGSLLRVDPVAGANNQAALKAADYLLHAKLLYSDNDPGSSGGRLTPAFH